ncbi:MAG: hypothetical protein PCFJNLEI_03196 [Verrucomicrobiae bacterium]|nr:hypothetical protein [Verrucomicrobiae bacterium]
MEPHSLIVTEIVKALMPKLLEHLGKKTVRDNDIEVRIAEHMSFVANWSQTVQFHGMAVAKDTAAATIPLTIDTLPRKFRGKTSRGKEVDELALIHDSYQYILLGDPGSGKTTTLKRMARRVLLEEPDSDDRWQFPVVVRLRDLDQGYSLLEHIAATFGIPFETRNEEIREKITWMERTFNKQSVSALAKSSRSDGRIEYDAKGNPAFRVKQIRQRYVLNTKLMHVLHDVFSTTNTLILLDGLDELSQDRHADTVQEIEALSASLRESKIVVTCRSGEYTRTLDGFHVMELCPLSRDQKVTIAKKWLPDADRFLNTLDQMPYSDLGDRPLFLTHLIILFQNHGQLPEQPGTIYKKIVHLMLELWDSQRRIARDSIYSSFMPDRKLEFLAALSFQLTYHLRRKTFSEVDLIDAYRLVCESFRLPASEAKEVVKEIESHTGLIFEGATDSYEFSHLSLQEYLAATYLVKASFSACVDEYVRDYPEPVAIAVAISSDPTSWLVELLLKRKTLHCFSPESAVSFLSRLSLERPYFTRSSKLGFAILRLAFEFPEATEYPIQRLLSDEFVTKSVKDALGYYVETPQQKHPTAVELVQSFDLTTLQFGYPALGGALRRSLYIKD